MSIIIAIIIIAFIIGSTNKTERWKKDIAKTMAYNQGGLKYDPCGERYDMVWQDIWYDWQGEKTRFQCEYLPYLEESSRHRSINRGPLDLYMECLENEQMRQEGYQPRWGGYLTTNTNLATVDFFAMFRNTYGEKARIFKETGRYYY